MGTAGGEPRVLLNALKPMLGLVGDIKTPQEVLRVVGMMKDAEKLMSRCVYLNILKSTCRQAKQSDEKRETLEKFLTTGGWGILNKWLHEFTKSENFPVLLELIDVLKILPITVELLKQGNTGKLIKQMTKLEHADVKKNAGSLIKQWKDMIRGGPDKKGSEETDGDESQSNKRNREVESKGPPEKRAKIKPNDPSSKQVSDSTGFMNALNAAVPVSIKKKRRNSNSKTTLPLDEILNKSSGDKKLKLEADNENVALANTNTEASSDLDAFDDNAFISPAVEAANQALARETDDGIVIDEGSLARKKNKKKRNITWPPDDQLVKVRYFELQEGERKGHHAENFSQARQHELLLEKQFLRAARQDKMVEAMKWRRLIPLDNAGVPNFMPGEKSREKFIQAEREKSVLAFIFLTKDSLPDFPAEPDFDPDEHSNNVQPRAIPHDEDGNIFPKPSLPSQQQQQSSQRKSSASDDEFSSSPTSKNAPPFSKPSNQTPPKDAADVSPAVQNIMSQLLRTNNQLTVSDDQVSALSTVISNMAPALLGNLGSSANNGPPPPPNRPQGPVVNAGFKPNTGNIPSILDNPIPNPRGRGNGPRFNIGRGGPPTNRGRGVFNGQGSGPRPRWDDSQQQPPMDDWNGPYNDNGNYNDNFGGNSNRGGGNFGNQGRPDGFNENFNDNFSGNQGGGSRGFRRGRGHQGMDRGRNRGGGNFDYRNNGGNEWNEDDRRDFPTNRGRGGRSRDDKAVCQHFVSPRGCRKGDRCNFLHPRR